MSDPPNVVMGTIRRMLGRRGYQVPSTLPFQNFQVENPNTGKTCLVWFSLDGKAGVTVIGDIVKQMEADEVYETILVTDGLTSHASQKLNSTNSPNFFICVMPPKSLMFDVCDHKFVPPHRILGQEEKKDVIKKYENGKLPVIDLDDPVSKYMGARVGDVFEIVRNRPNVGEHLYYRQVAKNNDH
jgi:DNA-directed RNA polymerase I, II, and III subunit RPABC1